MPLRLLRGLQTPERCTASFATPAQQRRAATATLSELIERLA